MDCDYCGATDTHRAFCPIPEVTFPPGGVATSHWADALQRAIHAAPEGTTDVEFRDLVIGAFVLHARWAERASYLRAHEAIASAVNGAELPPEGTPGKETIGEATARFKIHLEDQLKAVSVAAPVITGWTD